MLRDEGMSRKNSISLTGTEESVFSAYCQENVLLLIDWA